VRISALYSELPPLPLFCIALLARRNQQTLPATGSLPTVQTFVSSTVEHISGGQYLQEGYIVNNNNNNNNNNKFKSFVVLANIEWPITGEH
jgi:hypothetical protein